MIEFRAPDRIDNNRYFGRDPKYVRGVLEARGLPFAPITFELLHSADLLVRRVLVTKAASGEEVQIRYNAKDAEDVEMAMQIDRDKKKITFAPTRIADDGGYIFIELPPPAATFFNRRPKGPLFAMTPSNWKWLCDAAQPS